MENIKPARKHIRLKDKTAYYVHGQAVHLIIHFVCADSETLTASQIIASKITDISSEFNIDVYAYSVMPNHIHLLILQTPEFGAIEFVKYLKGRCVSGFRQANLAVKFQKSFYDHILRSDEDVKQVAEYIIANPVRSGITQKTGEHQFSGSLYYDL
ncbi:MAG: transposase [Deferribacterales bacterium]